LRTRRTASMSSRATRTRVACGSKSFSSLVLMSYTVNVTFSSDHNLQSEATSHQLADCALPLAELQSNHCSPTSRLLSVNKVSSNRFIPDMKIPRYLLQGPYWRHAVQIPQLFDDHRTKRKSHIPSPLSWILRQQHLLGSSNSAVSPADILAFSSLRRLGCLAHHSILSSPLLLLSALGTSSFRFPS